MKKSIKRFLMSVPLILSTKYWLTRTYYRWKQRRNFGKQSSAPSSSPVLREEAEGAEAGFWAFILSQKTYSERLDPNIEINSELSKLLDQSCEHDENESLVVLDVGSGPLTSVMSMWHGRRLKIIPVDPLAKRYEKILAELNVVAPFPAVEGDGENLEALFQPNSVSLVNILNALDHSITPIKCLESVVNVLKPGCFAYLWHFENEAEKENYSGMHQWNLFERDKDMIIANKVQEFSVRSIFRGRAEVNAESRLTRNGVVVCTIRKLDQ